MDVPDISDKAQRVDPNGDLRLPMIGRAGVTVHLRQAEVPHRPDRLDAIASLLTPAIVNVAASSNRAPVETISIFDGILATRSTAMEHTPFNVRRRRTRTIAFRVSEREFEMLKVKSQAEGARSISDLARLVLCGSATESGDRVEKGLNQLSGEIQQLSVEVRRATELLQTARPSAPGRPQISLSPRKSNRGV